MNTIQPTQISVKSLRQSGLRVRVNYYRFAEFDKNKPVRVMYPVNILRKIAAEKEIKHIFDSKGGLTHIEVLDVNTGKIYESMAKCHENDAFNKKCSINICIQRLLPKFDFKLDNNA